MCDCLTKKKHKQFEYILKQFNERQVIPMDVCRLIYKYFPIEDLVDDDYMDIYG